MKIEGTYVFDAPRQVVWQALLDANILAKTMPGCEQLEQMSENEYKGILRIRVGPVQGQFEGVVTLSNLEPPLGYHMQVSGQGAPGFVKGEGDVRLEEKDSSTLMHYSGTAQVGGRIASVGQRLLDSSARALTRQSLDELKTQINGLSAAKVSVESLPQPNGPSQIQFATGAARHMLAELVPAERRPLLMGALAILASTVLVFWVLGEWWMNKLVQRVADKVTDRRCS